MNSVIGSNLQVKRSVLTNRLILAALFACQILDVVCSVVQFAVFLHMPMGECVCQLAQLSQVTENLPTLISGTVRFPSKGSEETKSTQRTVI